jgi:hypothetical protein
MAKLGIRKVATTDAHFEKVGFINLLKNPTQESSRNNMIQGA